MAKQHIEPPSRPRRRESANGASRRDQSSASRLPPPTGTEIPDSAPLFMHRLVVARTQLERLPEAGRRLFVRGLAHSVQRRTTSAPGDVTVQRQPNPLKTRAATVLATLNGLIAGADWPTMRKRLYPQQSAAGIQRAKDRKAGKATDLTGLGKITSLNRFAGAMKAMQADWPTKSMKDRIDALGAAANAELTQAGVPNFMIVDKSAMTAKAAFSAGAWGFFINEGLLTSRNLDAATAGQLANAAMHESRHAEQHFLAARYSAGFNKTDEAGLVAEQGIPTPIAKEAVKNKFDAMSDMAVAMVGQRMFKRYVTDVDAHDAAAGLFDPALEDMKDKRAKAETARTALAKAVTSAAVTAAEQARDALKAAITELHKAYVAYRGVPSEADAHEVGDAAELAFKGWQ